MGDFTIPEVPEVAHGNSQQRAESTILEILGAIGNHWNAICGAALGWEVETVLPTIARSGSAVRFASQDQQETVVNPHFSAHLRMRDQVSPFLGDKRSIFLPTRAFHVWRTTRVPQCIHIKVLNSAAHA